MKNIASCVKTLVLLTTFAFAGHALAAQDTWFSVTANGSNLDLDNASTNGITEGVEVDQSVLSIDLPTNTVFQIAPTDSTAGGNKKTYVVVDDAEFTPTAVEDIDNSVLVDAQTALTVAYDENNATNYYAYITNNWVKLSGQDPVAAPVDVTIELDYSNAAQTNATFKVGGLTLHDEFNNETFPISGAQRALGRIDLAGYGKIHSVTTTVEAVASLTITPGTVTYGADFTNVTITATIEGEGAASATYKLNWKNNEYVMTAVSLGGNNFELSAQIPIPANGREPVEYTISATVGGNPAGTSDTATTVVADNRDWVTENSTHTGPTGTGTWSNNVEYVNTVATVSDNTYTANSCSTGDLVTVTFENIVYAELSDLSVETPEGTQGAFALAETNINNQVSTNFCVLAMENNAYTWKAATCTGVAINTNIEYTVVMTFDYVANKYSVKVSDGTSTSDLVLAGTATTAFDLCVAKTAVTDFVFKGSATMTGITGVDSTGYMAKDNSGNWFASILAATQSGGKEFIILRPTGAAPSGWKFVITEDGIKKLVKAAKGMFFMAY